MVRGSLLVGGPEPGSLGLPLIRPWTLLAILSFSILSIWPNHRRTPSSILSSASFVTPHHCLIRTFGTLSILLIPSKPLRLSICTPLILILYIIVSLPYVRTGTSNDSCKTVAHSSYKPLALTRDLIGQQPSSHSPPSYDTMPHMSLIRPKHTPIFTHYLLYTKRCLMSF